MGALTEVKEFQQRQRAKSAAGQAARRMPTKNERRAAQGRAAIRGYCKAARAKPDEANARDTITAILHELGRGRGGFDPYEQMATAWRNYEHDKRSV